MLSMYETHFNKLVAIKKNNAFYNTFFSSHSFAILWIIKHYIYHAYVICFGCYLFCFHAIRNINYNQYRYSRKMNILYNFFFYTKI